jgi:hypothetical protein
MTVIGFLAIIGFLIGITLYQQTKNFEQDGCIKVNDIPVTEWLHNEVIIKKDWFSGYWVCRR